MYDSMALTIFFTVIFGVKSGGTADLLGLQGMHCVMAAGGILEFFLYYAIMEQTFYKEIYK